MDGEIHVGAKLVMNARLTFSVNEPATIYPEKTRHLMATIYDVWLRDATVVGPEGKSNV